MIEIHDITNSIFTSKTYILSNDGENRAWLVDIGDINPVLSYLKERNLVAEGVFLTHAHFDHIYGIESLVKQYPACKVYCTEYAKEALASEKLNMSKYHESPVTYSGSNVFVLKEGDEIRLFDNEPKIQMYETPGHNPGCLTMVLGNIIFTGDAYIPGVGVNTIPPHSNKAQAKESLERILKLAEGRIIFSGHQINNS